MPGTPLTEATEAFRAEALREQFPILKTRVGKYPLIYFDNAATTQKPERVIEAVAGYYRHTNANIHRGAHFLADKGTEAFENARKKVASLIGAESPEQVIFTRGTTESINMVAWGLSVTRLRPGDEVLITGMEHHANIVPWQMACERSGATLRVIPVLDSGELDMDQARRLIHEKTRVLSLVYVSNSLGTVNPVAPLLKMAREAGAVTLLDCAQAVGHFTIDAAGLDADFLAFSGHKMFGPTGTGILYGRREQLEALPPMQGGGEMIREVRFEKTTWNDLPFRLEAGTPHISGVIGLGEAADFLMSMNRHEAEKWEKDLLARAMHIIGAIPGLRVIGRAQDRVSVVSFVSEKAHPSDIGTLLDGFGVAVRTGHHCCQPLMHRFDIPGTVRVSLSLYNTPEEVDRFGEYLEKTLAMLA